MKKLTDCFFRVVGGGATLDGGGRRSQAKQKWAGPAFLRGGGLNLRWTDVFGFCFGLLLGIFNLLTFLFRLLKFHGYRKLVLFLCSSL